MKETDKSKTKMNANPGNRLTSQRGAFLSPCLCIFLIDLIYLLEGALIYSIAISVCSCHCMAIKPRIGVALAMGEMSVALVNYLDYKA